MQQQEAGKFIKLTPHTYSNYEWHKTKSIRKQRTLNTTNTIRIATFNVLFDIYANDKLHHSCRYEKQLREFETQSFDILCLNEVTSSYLNTIVMDDFICDTYNISEIIHYSNTYSTLLPYGTLLLSKFPMVDLVEYTFNYGFTMVPKPNKKNKSCLFATLLVPCNETKSTRRVGVCCVHLKAGSKYENEVQRKQQLSEIYEIAQRQYSNADEFIILGDFNFQQSGEDQGIDQLKYTDLWPSMRNDPGYTCDASINTLMTVMKPLEKDEDPWKRRLDRIVLRKNGKWNVTEIGLFANKPIFENQKQTSTKGNGKKVATLSKEDYLFMSDHFGVFVTIQ
jgi:endonuclease/exonuclease/phosphatase family metal-dependent hydrolase